MIVADYDVYLFRVICFFIGIGAILATGVIVGNDYDVDYPAVNGMGIVGLL